MPPLHSSRRGKSGLSGAPYRRPVSRPFVHPACLIVTRNSVGSRSIAVYVDRVGIRFGGEAHRDKPASRYARCCDPCSAVWLGNAVRFRCCCRERHVLEVEAGCSYAATVSAEAPDCDLALLHVDDHAFWNDLPLSVVHFSAVRPSLLGTPISADSR